MAGKGLGLLFGGLAVGGIVLLSKRSKAANIPIQMPDDTLPVIPLAPAPANIKIVSNELASTYDDLFKQLGSPDIPSSYLWALAKHESALKPDATGAGGEAGLMQIAKVTARAYNTANPNTPIKTDAELKQPENNIRVAVWLIRRILATFTKYHPQTLKTDWNSPRFVGLVTQAYNVGESESAGVARAVKELEKKKTPIEQITPANTAKIAEQLKFNKWMPEKPRLAFIDRVVKDYFKKLNQSPLVS